MTELNNEVVLILIHKRLFETRPKQMFILSHAIDITRGSAWFKNILKEE